MKILIITDTHGGSELPEITPDLILLLGDVDFYEIRKIDKKYNCPKLGVLGNHDAPDYFDETDVINLHKKVVDIKGIKIAGFEGCPKYNKRKYLQYTEEEVGEFTKDLEGVDIFMAHANPKLEPNLDETNAHRGFEEFTNYIKEKQPTYFIHGHNHRVKEEKIDKTNVLSLYRFHILDI